MNILIKLAIRACISGAAYMAGSMVVKEMYTKVNSKKQFNTAKKEK